MSQPRTARPNARLVLGVGLNTLLALVASHVSNSTTFAAVLAPFVTACLVGLSLLLAGKAKAGALLVMLGSAGFLPLGLVAFAGARQVLDDLEQQRFNTRRASAR